MDTEYDPSAAMDGVSDVEDAEPTERRHRRDFVGTEMERAKKGSRRNTKKRQRAGLIHVEENEESPSNSTMETQLSPRTPSRRALS